MRKRDITKAKIGEAAMQCFAKWGLEKTTLEDIAKVIGLNKSSLYYYYKNKEDIFIEAALEEGERYISSLQLQTVQKQGIEEQVWYYMQSRFEYYMNVLNFNAVSTETLHKMLPRFFELYEALMKREKTFLAKLIQAAIEKKEIAPVNATEIASVLIHISDALKHSVEQRAILQRDDKIDYSQSLADMKYLITLMFKGLQK